jgi:hypothetical protein
MLRVLRYYPVQEAQATPKGSATCQEVERIIIVRPSHDDHEQPDGGEEKRRVLSDDDDDPPEVRDPNI